MKQLDFFISNEHLVIEQDYVDLADVYVNFGYDGRRRSDLTDTSEFLKTLPREKYVVFKTGARHPMHEYINGSNNQVYEGKNYPYILNTYSNKKLKPSFSRAVYPSYNIHGKGVYAHRIFAMAFVTNASPVDTYNVDHINEDKLDFKVTNLQWVSTSDNLRNVRNNAKNKKRRIKFYNTENYVD